MDTKARILLAEDDANLGMLLREYLIAKGFQTTLCEDGNIAYDAFLKEPFDICIFDVMMPHKDGFSLAKDIKKVNSDIPVIFLTAKSLKEDILEGLKLGADDYITKPFSMEELLLRIEAILRRIKPMEANAPKEFQIGTLKFDPEKQIMQQEDGTLIKLTTKESELLRMLAINANKVMERNIALKTIWNDDNYFNARSMDVYITKLRKHLKQEEGVEIINVHGRGYKLII